MNISLRNIRDDQVIQVKISQENFAKTEKESHEQLAVNEVI